MAELASLRGHSPDLGSNLAQAALADIVDDSHAFFDVRAGGLGARLPSLLPFAAVGLILLTIRHPLLLAGSVHQPFGVPGAFLPQQPVVPAPGLLSGKVTRWSREQRSHVVFLPSPPGPGISHPSLFGLCTGHCCSRSGSQLLLPGLCGGAAAPGGAAVARP
jgi:hypothetical protein